MNIIVTKLTNDDRLRKANSFCTGRESNMTLKTAYRLGHTPIRSQLFDVELYDIPLFVASQLVRQKLGVDWYMKSKRTDRGGIDFRKVCDGISVGLADADISISRGKKSDAQLDITAAINAIDELPEHFDRYAPTDLYGQNINAEALINMAHKRLCMTASRETREVVEHIKALVEECDPDLAMHMVRPCVACGVCREAKSCGFMATEKYQAERRFYKAMFVKSTL